MNNIKNKKLYIVLATIAIIFLLLIIILKVKDKEKKNTEPILPTIDLMEVFDLENIENTKYEIKKSNNENISAKYTAKEKYVINADVEFNERKGKMIYVRDTNSKMNIYKTKYRIDELDYTNTINKYMNEFLNSASSFIGGEILRVEDGMVYGENASTEYIEERIFKDRKLYTIHYEEDNGSNSDIALSDKKKYDINFYMEDKYLMCELVKIL